MQPPPLPDGTQIAPLPATEPLCATNDPSLPKDVSEPSKTGDLAGS